MFRRPLFDASNNQTFLTDVQSGAAAATDLNSDEDDNLLTQALNTQESLSAMQQQQQRRQSAVAAAVLDETASVSGMLPSPPTKKPKPFSITNMFEDNDNANDAGAEMAERSSYRRSTNMADSDTADSDDSDAVQLTKKS